jgi:hypothetical protein
MLCSIVKIYILWDTNGYTYDTNVYMGKGQAGCNTDNDSYTCDSEKSDKEIRMVRS